MSGSIDDGLNQSNALSRFRSIGLGNLLRNNGLPPGNLAPVLSQARYDLTHGIPERIAALQNEINFLRAEHNQLTAHVQLADSLGAPIRRLPREILTTIFHFFCSENPCRISSAGIRLPPMILTAICKSWRELTLSRGALWSVIDWRTYNLRPRVQENTKERILDHVLKMSSSAPLDVDIYYSYSCEDSPRVVLDRLFQQAHRWRSACIHLPFTIEPPEGVRFSELRTVHLGSRTIASLDDLVQFASPKLSSIHIGYYALGQHHPRSLLRLNGPVHFPSLRTLTCSCNQVDFQLDLLAAFASQVRNFTTDFTLFSTSRYSTVVQLPTLESLTLGVPRCRIRWKTLTALLSKLVAPSVTQFTLSGPSDLPQLRCAFFIDGLVRDIFAFVGNQPSLTALTVSPIPLNISAEDVIGTLRLLPSLSNLSLAESHDGGITVSSCECLSDEDILSSSNHSVSQATIFSPLFFTSLNLDGTNVFAGPLVSKLSRLQLSVRPEQFEMGSLVDAVRSRCRRHSTQLPVDDQHSFLESVYLKVLGDSVSREAYEGLALLRHTGLLVTVQDKDGNLDARDSGTIEHV